MIATTTERERVKQGLQCPECWSMNTKVAATFSNASNTEALYECRTCSEQWDKHYFGEDEQEDRI